MIVIVMERIFEDLLDDCLNSHCLLTDQRKVKGEIEPRQRLKSERDLLLQP